MATIPEVGLEEIPGRSATSGVARSGRLRWSSDQFRRLAELGFFGELRVELLSGEIWSKMTTNGPHGIASELLNNAIRPIFAVGYRVRDQLPLDLGLRSQPEPDLTILAGDPRDSGTHPTMALLIIEISDTTLRKDRHIKSHVYARAGIPDYWIVNLVDRQLEIRRNPGPDPSRRGRFRYADVTIVPADGSASPLARPDVLISVADLLP